MTGANVARIPSARAGSVPAWPGPPSMVARCGRAALAAIAGRLHVRRDARPSTTTRPCSTTPRSTRSTSRCPTTCTATGSSGAGRGQARAVREAAGLHARPTSAGHGRRRTSRRTWLLMEAYMAPFHPRTVRAGRPGGRGRLGGCHGRRGRVHLRRRLRRRRDHRLDPDPRRRRARRRRLLRARRRSSSWPTPSGAPLPDHERTQSLRTDRGVDVTHGHRDARRFAARLRARSFECSRSTPRHVSCSRRSAPTRGVRSSTASPPRRRPTPTSCSTTGTARSRPLIRARRPTPIGAWSTTSARSSGRAEACAGRRRMSVAFAELCDPGGH